MDKTREVARIPGTKITGEQMPALKASSFSFPFNFFLPFKQAFFIFFMTAESTEASISISLDDLG